MKVKSLLLHCVIVLLLCSMIVTDCRICCSLSFQSSIAPNDNISSASWYKDNLPIHISGDDDFADQAIANSWDGNGSISNPYIIEGLNITVTGTPAIQIVNTTVFFEVRGCLVVGGSTAIHLENITNAKIWNNTIQNSVSCGLLVTESHGVLVTNNTIHTISDVASQGVYSHTSEFCEFSNNTVQNVNGWSILADYSHNCSITLNRIHDCSRDGIALRDSSENNITRNEVMNSDMSGIKLGNSHRCRLEKNLVGHSLSDGISIEASTGCVVEDNVLFNSGAYSLDITGSSAVVIANTFYRSQVQGFRCQSDNNYIAHNNFIEHGLAISGDPTYVAIMGSGNIVTGNYYDIWTWPDDNEDEIVDFPYPISFDPVLNDPEPHVKVFQTDLMHILTKPRLVYPNETLAGEKFWGLVQLRWSIAGDTFGHDATYNVSVSANGGSSWTEIAYGMTATELDWNSSEFLESAEYRFKVVAQCTDGLISEYISAGEYEVKSHTLSVPTVLFPNGGETIIGGCEITWDASLESWGLQVTYDVYYSIDGGEWWIKIFANLDGNGVFWDVRTLPAGDEYLIRVVARNPFGLKSDDASDSFFSIASMDYSLLILIGVTSVMAVAVVVYAFRRKRGI